MKEVYDEKVQHDVVGPVVLHRLPARGVAAGPRAPRRPGLRRALRADRRRVRAVQRLQRAERPGRAARRVRGRGARQGRAATPRPATSTSTTSARSSTGMPPHRRPRHRDRPAGDAAGERRLDPRGHPLPDAAPRVRPARRRARRRAAPARCPTPIPGQRRRSERRRRVDVVVACRHGPVRAHDPAARGRRAAPASPPASIAALTGARAGSCSCSPCCPFVHTRIDRLDRRRASIDPFWLPVAGHVVSVVVGLLLLAAGRPAAPAQTARLARRRRAVRGRRDRARAQGPPPGRAAPLRRHARGARLVTGDDFRAPADPPSLFRLVRFVPPYLVAVLAFGAVALWTERCRDRPRG